MAAPDVPSGKLAVNVMHFARVLRAAGIANGPGAVIDALRALAEIDLTRRQDVRACLEAVLVRQHADHELFVQAFDAFFRDPFSANQALSLLLPHSQVGSGAPRPDLARRISEALNPQRAERLREQRAAGPRPPGPDDLEIDARFTFSEREVLARKDFAEMSSDELAGVRAALARMRVLPYTVPSRRLRPDPHGPRVDLRATLRAGLRNGGHDIPLRFRDRRQVTPPLVVLCDISGSMGRYSEMLLRFIHAVASSRRRVHAFVFGTRLSNVTRALRGRDVDAALARCGREVLDWSGGTRIGACLREFNRAWSRRVLGQGATVLLITDGLDRDASAGLSEEAERLHKSCRRLIWLNPLLSFEAFEPQALGIRLLLPHVDDFRPVHNLSSIEQLAAALGRPAHEQPAPGTAARFLPRHGRTPRAATAGRQRA
jgi:uncharacterized protein with von Willebrand factor type A (vWA) domain